MTDHRGLSIANQPEVQIGAVLVGRYRIERVLGQGGMGVVVQATHLQLQQPVAMKFLLPEVLGNHQIVQRFLREAQAAVRLRSEHVARVIDVGSLESGAPYMVLEYLEGADLANFHRAHLSVGGIVDLMLQACEALAEAHSIGIVHRDIKPANFFITRGADGALLLKVLDFGISKTSTTNTQLTGTQSVMGTPAYMSPEQMRSSRDVDHRSDIWSLGVVLFELLQGAPPFGGDTFSSMVIKIVTEPLPRLTVPLPGDLASVVYRCLEKDPARRFQNVAELAQALAVYAQSGTQAALSVQRTRSIVGLESHRGALDPGPTRRDIPSTISGAVGAKTTPPARSKWPIMAVLGAVLAAVAIAVVASSGGRSSDGKTADGVSPVAQPAPPPPPAASPPPATPAPTTPSTQAPTGTTPSAPATPEPTTPEPAATAQTAPATGTAPVGQPPANNSADPSTTPAASGTDPVSTTTPSVGSAAEQPTTAAKKPKKTTKTGKSDGSAKPPDDDILGSRN